MNCKWSFLGKHRLEQAMELLTNMSDCKDESTSESKNEGDSSDSTEDAPEQHQVRTDSNILMPKETKRLISRVPQSMLYWLIKQPQHQVLHLQKYLKPKEISRKGQKAAPKLVDNQSATKTMASNSDIDVED